MGHAGRPQRLLCRTAGSIPATGATLVRPTANGAVIPKRVPAKAIARSTRPAAIRRSAMDPIKEAMIRAEDQGDTAKLRGLYETYWDGWNDACDANIPLSWWKRAIAELNHKLRG